MLDPLHGVVEAVDADGGAPPGGEIPEVEFGAGTAGEGLERAPVRIVWSQDGSRFAMVRRDETNRVMDDLYDVGARAILVTSIHACRI